VPVPALALLTYRVPEDWPAPTLGARVRAPLGPRTVTGIVMVVDPPAPEGVELRALTELLDPEPFLPSSVVSLAEWVAEYYLAGPARPCRRRCRRAG
jgi:primosomal protein N' (replication factor Y) (superfamily II helicase)